MIASVISNQDIKLMTESLSKEEAIFAQVNAEKLILTGANKRETYIINLTKSPRSSLKKRHRKTFHKTIHSSQCKRDYEVVYKVV
jgi:hypothetical protein